MGHFFSLCFLKAFYKYLISILHSYFIPLTLLHSERTKLYRVLAVLSAIGLNDYLLLNKIIGLFEGESITNQPFPFLMDLDSHDFHALF